MYFRHCFLKEETNDNRKMKVEMIFIFPLALHKHGRKEFETLLLEKICLYISIAWQKFIRC